MKHRNLAILGFLVAVSLMLSYIEFLVPVMISIPGIKLGLANLIIVYCLYTIGWREAILINIVRIILCGLLFGNLFSISFSLAGGILSFLMMLIAYKMNVSKICVSIIGGVTHNLGQLAIAVIWVKSGHILIYAPVLILVGIMTGAIIGYLNSIMVKHTIHYFNRNETTNS